MQTEQTLEYGNSAFDHLKCGPSQNSFYIPQLNPGPERQPRSLLEIDVSETVLEDLALKTLYLAGALSVLQLANRMELDYEVANELFCRMRQGLLCQVTGLAANIPHITITSTGRSRAVDLLSQSLYHGAAPVSIQNYVMQIKKQSVKNVTVHYADINRAFATLVLEEQTLRQLGTALNSGSSLFLYGPPGVGKTTIAETLSQVMAENDVWIPHALEVDGQIITVYDPSIHKRKTDPTSDGHDPRWVLCQRPAVLTGGELTADMLDLQFNPVSKFYVGPVQMKANNGVLIIDDFGRQKMRPDELLNRWIVPLDRRIDYLTLAGGKKIEIPFELLVVFASNLDPAELVDPSFLRRIQTKIHIGASSDEQFCEIFRRVAIEKRVPFDANIPYHLISFIRDSLGSELRACYARDIINQVTWAARFDDREPYLDLTALKQAIAAYFLKRPTGQCAIEAMKRPMVPHHPANARAMSAD